jgi:hypothetical protein
MKNVRKIFTRRKRRQPFLPETDPVDAPEDQSTSNPDLTAQTPSPPFGCEILFEGTTPIVAE